VAWVQAAYAAQIIADPGDATLEEQERALDSRARELGWTFQPNRLESLRYAKDGMKAFLIPVSGEIHVRVQRSSDRWSRLELGTAGAVVGAALGGAVSAAWAWGRRRRVAVSVPAGRD